MQIELLAKSSEAFEYLQDLSIPDVVARTAANLGEAHSHLNIVVFAVKGRSLSAAKVLAKVRDGINHENIMLLRDEPPKRFESDLYSLFADFERELRRTLTLYRTLNNDESHTVPDHPEQHDFGAIFSSLFVDDGFVKRVKSIVNTKGGFFEKEEIIKLLSSEDEFAYWDALFPADAMPTIRNRHTEIRKFRNDVMHSHLMTIKDYNKAKRLLENAIGEMVEFSSKDISTDAAAAAEAFSERAILETKKAITEAFRRFQSENGIDNIGKTARSLSNYSATQNRIGQIIQEAWLNANEPLLSTVGAVDVASDAYRRAFNPLVEASKRAADPTEINEQTEVD